MTKETEEFLVLLEATATAVSKSLDDGDLDWTDLRFFMPLIVAGREALKDADKIPEEFKNANGEELEANIMRGVAAITILLDAVMNKKIK